MNRIIIFLLFCYSISNAGAILDIGGGYPIGLINNLNNSMQSFANNNSGKLDKSAIGGTFLLDITFLSTPKDSSSTTLFGVLAGYSYNGTSETSVTAPGFQNQIVNIKMKVDINEIKCEPGVLFLVSDSKIGIFLGGGALYSIVGFHETASDNDAHYGTISGSFGSGLGLCGIGRLIFGLENGAGLGLQAEITNLNFTVGAFIAGISF